MPHIVSITYTPADSGPRPPDRYARVEVQKATLIAERGIDGDRKASAGKRQLNLMRVETVEKLREEGFFTRPGQLGEQLVIAGLPDTLIPGSRLRLGETAVIEITVPRTPCDRFEHIQGQPKVLAKGRIGVMARVMSGGEITVGDEVSIETP